MTHRFVQVYTLLRMFLFEIKECDIKMEDNGLVEIIVVK